MEIIIRHSSIQIRDYELGSCIDLERQFQYYSMGKFTYIPLAIYYDEEKKTLYIPRGIDIWWLESKLGTKAVVDYNCDPYKYIDEVNLLTPPRDNQKEALRFMICAGEYEKNAKKSQLSLNLNTGKGKTYISIASIAYYQITTMIIMSSTSWIKQWIERVQDYTNITKKEMKVITGSAQINKLLKTKDPKYKIYFVTHSSINGYAREYGWESIGKLFRHLGIGIKIYDEAHQEFANMAMIDFFTNTFKTFYVTASPARSDDGENHIYSLYMKNVPAIDLFDPESDPHVKYIAIKFNSNPNIYDLNACKNNYGFNRIAYIEYLTNKDEYYQLLRIILNLYKKCGGKCLIYIGTNEAINITMEWVKMNYPEYSDIIGIYTSVVPAKEKEYVKKNCNIIFSTSKSAGAAVDIPGLKLVVNINEPYKSHVIAQQEVGRPRTDAYYIDCVDVGFKQLLRYYYYKQPVFEKYCTSRDLITIGRNELAQRAEKLEREHGSIDVVTMNVVEWMA